MRHGHIYRDAKGLLARVFLTATGVRLVYANGNTVFVRIAP